MSCAGCAVSTETGVPKGCKSNGHCKTGGCNKLNTFDWLADLPVAFGMDDNQFYEVSFKNGSRKGFYKNDKKFSLHTHDMVVVETSMGADVGRVSLSGELVRLQMKKKRVKENSPEVRAIVRQAGEKDLENLERARSQEKEAMVRGRAIARSLNLDMKIGDVEYQADGKKATFYYTADGRVDFRELIKAYAREFKVKIEMRQIGARQEAGKIGGIGSCGRELCCSTWLTDFKSVATTAARYQNLSINLSKLSGQCGRLKCCLNYELDTYMEAMEAFPDKADKLDTLNGTAFLQKTDVLKQIMWYSYAESPTFYSLTVEQVKESLELNRNGKKAPSLVDLAIPTEPEEKEVEYEDLVGHISLATLEKKDKKKRRKGGGKGKMRTKGKGPNDGGGKQSGAAEGNANRSSGGSRNRNNRNRKRRDNDKK